MPEKAYQPGEHYNYQLTIKSILATPIIYAPDKEIVYRDKVRYTYRTLYERINRLAGGLAKLGVEKGDRICIFDYDSHRYLECYFAVPMMGAVMHMINWRLSPEQVLYTINHTEDDVVLIHADFMPFLESIWDKITTIKKIILLQDDDAKVTSRLPIDTEYEAMLKGASPAFDFPELDENTMATTFYTTGTTGLPKAVHFTHRQLVLHTLSVGLAAGCLGPGPKFNSGDVYMPITPMFHVHAWGLPYLATLLGTKQVYPGKYEPEMLLRLVLTEKVTFSHCVPTIMLMIAMSPAVKKFDLSNWKVIIGGATFSKALAKATSELKIQAYSGYGMSETCPVMTVATFKDDMAGISGGDKIDIVTKTGLPLPLCRIEIVDPMDQPLPHDGVTSGEIVARAPWLTESYLKDPKRTGELWKNGWLHTGDIATVDENGYFMITDRLKDIIKTGGEWISSVKLENLACQHDAVGEAAAIGIPDPKWDERPIILAVLKPGFEGKATGEDIRDFMRGFVEKGEIPKYALPDRVEIVKEIPKTSVGKINKVDLRNKFAVKAGV